ncbi:MAG: polymer-forming cytoskeletal protein [Pseudoxanthomonas sp.]|nr:polymer-forming cytoskeletal protein [Pseudoxanthomonas sp.]
MFGGKQPARQGGNGQVDTLIGRNTRVEGDVHFTGGLYVDGQVKGSILAEKGGEAMLSISEQGRVEGEVRVPHVVVNGHLAGNILGAEKVELLPNAQVQGNIHYKLLQMAVGAAVTGQLVQERETPRQLSGPDGEP